jgi:dynein heavy chain
VYTSFANSNTGSYLPVDSAEQLKKIVDAKLYEYNESNAIMDLVLFDQAAEHICRISRIISNPQGNAMLIGVGGSGKQSLSRLAAFISGFEVRQLQVTGSFKVDDLLEAFREMFKQSGVKGIPIVFLMTDTQVVDDRFLIYINAILASGWISGLFAKVSSLPSSSLSSLPSSSLSSLPSSSSFPSSSFPSSSLPSLPLPSLPLPSSSLLPLPSSSSSSSSG